MTVQEPSELAKRLRVLGAAHRPDRQRPTSAASGSGLLPSCLLLLLAGLLLAGYASIPKDYPRTQSLAFAAPQSTAIGRYVAKAAARHPGASGFAINRHGRPALTTWVTFSELAQDTLDLQYYIWEPDATGSLLAERILRAADRGVRVHVLLDDISFKDRDADLAALDAHPNIEIRLFNPFAHRSVSALDFVADFNRVNHRMHNE